MNISVSRKRIFLICWITYVVVYLGRVNISVAMTGIENAFQGGTELSGLIGSLFFVVYATGQLINGFLGDRVPPRSFVAVALLGSAAMNLLVGLSGNAVMVAVCWGINGYFQSMVWGPLMRVLSGLYEKDELGSVSVRMSATMAVGYTLTWAVMGRAVMGSSWRLLFIIPSVVGVLMLAAWLVFIPKMQSQPAGGTHQKRSIVDSLRMIGRCRLWLTVAACSFMGMVKEGVSLWAPILFVQAIGFELQSSLLLVLIIPFANLLGVFFAGWLTKKLPGHVLHPVLTMCGVILLGAGAMSLPLGLPKAAAAALLALISAMSAGCNNIFLSLIPLSYGRENMASTLVGMFDFSTYVGAALSSVATGFLVARFGWGVAPVMWLAACFMGALLLAAQVLRSGRDKQEEPEAAVAACER